MSDNPEGAVVFWTDAPWEAWPPMRYSREDAVQDGEDARQREIARLQRCIEFVRAQALGVTEYDPHAPCEITEDDEEA